MLLRLRLSPHALKEFTDNADATDFIFSRISFCVATWYWIYYGLYLRLYGAGFLQQELIRENLSARQAQRNPTTQ